MEFYLLNIFYFFFLTQNLLIWPVILYKSQFLIKSSLTLQQIKFYYLTMDDFHIWYKFDKKGLNFMNGVGKG